MISSYKLRSTSNIYFEKRSLKKNIGYKVLVISGGSRISRRGGGVDLVGGDVDSRGSYVLKILYVKTKELGPLGGAHPARPLDPPMVIIYM